TARLWTASVVTIKDTESGRPVRHRIALSSFPMPRHSWFALFIELEAGRLFAVADEEPAVGNNRMVPGFARKRLELSEFLVHPAVGVHERDFACLRKNDELVGIREQQHLAVAVTARLPDPLSAFEVHTGEKRTVEAVDVSAMHDEVVVVRSEGER